jgi:hypothetical protein
MKNLHSFIINDNRNEGEFYAEIFWGDRFVSEINKDNGILNIVLFPNSLRSVSIPLDIFLEEVDRIKGTFK